MTAWKALERTVAKKVGGKRKIDRGSNFMISDFDVEIPDRPHLKIDAKYSSKPWAHHKLIEKGSLTVFDLPDERYVGFWLDNWDNDWVLPYRYARKEKLRAATLLEEVARKYCKQPGDVPVLVTKTKGQRGEVVLMREVDLLG